MAGPLLSFDARRCQGVDRKAVRCHAQATNQADASALQVSAFALMRMSDECRKILQKQLRNKLETFIKIKYLELSTPCNLGPVIATSCNISTCGSQIMTFSKLFAMLTIAGVCGLSASISSAATVKVMFDTPNIFSGSGYDNVSISYPGTNNQAVSAGRFQGTAIAHSGVDASIFVDGLSDLYMYCYDVYEDIEKGQTVDYTISFNGVEDRTLQFLGAVNTVMMRDKGSTTYDPFAWLHPLTGQQGAAIQLGIWESLYDTSGWDLSGGDFTAKGMNATTNDWWNTFKTAIGVQDLDRKYVMTFEAKGAQDMITGDPRPSEVPEPGSLALLGVVLAGLAATRRNKGSAE